MSKPGGWPGNCTGRVGGLGSDEKKETCGPVTLAKATAVRGPLKAAVIVTFLTD